MSDDRSDPAPLIVSLFGSVSVRVHGVDAAPLTTRKGAYLLSLLALRHDREVERSYLAGLLWPDSDQEKALFNLRQTLLRLRHALGAEAWRITSPSRHALKQELRGASVDLLDFDAAVARGAPDSLRDAAALYKGALLEGCEEDWVFGPRLEREHAYLAALEQLAAYAAQAGDYSGAAGHLRQVIAVAPLREAIYRSLMQAHVAAGEYAEATLLYRDLRLLLHRELNGAPAPETVELYRQLRAEARAGARSTATPVLSVHVPQPPACDREHQVLPEAAGGAVPLDSPLYVRRPTDARLEAAIASRHSVILVKGTRQTGKTSLLVRGLEEARRMRAVVVYTNVSALDAAVLGSRETLYRALMGELADQLDLDAPPGQGWSTGPGANTNLDRYLRREILGGLDRPLVWTLDEVDRLFACEFRNEVFALFRSWHDRRAMDPTGSWSRLTLALSYATEAHLFITDLNQSPFNVGTRLSLDDFTLEQVAGLNTRYGGPLKSYTEICRFHALVGGHPHLVRRGLDAMLTGTLDIDWIEAWADREDGPFGSHLQELYRTVVQDPELPGLLRAVLRGSAPSSEVGFYRLFSAGVLAGSAEHEPRLRCRVYDSYLSRRLL